MTDQLTELAQLLELGFTIEEAVASIEYRITHPLDQDQMDAKRDGEDWWNK